MSSKSSIEFFQSKRNTYLVFQTQIIEFAPVINELPIEVITIVCNINEWIQFSTMLKEFLQKLMFILFIEHCEFALVFLSWRILKIFNVFRYDFSINN